MDNEGENIDNIFQSIPQSLICHFTTHLSQYTLDNLQIDISTQLDEEALNKILKELLEGNIEGKLLENVVFDFLVEGKLLRGKIKSHLVRYQISCEKVIQIQYFVGFKNMDQIHKSPQQDWIGSICPVMGVNQNLGIFSAMYNGSISFHSKPSKKQPKEHKKIHEETIKSIRSLPSNQPNLYYAITGGLGEQIKISTFKQNQQFSTIAHNQYEGTITAIDINPILDGHFCVTGSSGILTIYKIPQNFLQDSLYNSSISSETKKKKKKTNKMVPKVTHLQCHRDSIMSACWFSSTQIVTGSNDHSMKIIDVEKMHVVKTFLTKDSITTGIDYSNNTFISSHQDGYLRLWDARNPNSPSSSFKSHSKYVSCTAFSISPNIFASGCYDQTVKIWDTRSVFPLQTISTDYDKIFCLSWLSDKCLVSGGSSPFLTFHQT